MWRITEPTKETDDFWRSIYEQLWATARHQNDERLTFTSIYSVVVAGVLAFLSQSMTESSAILAGLFLFLFVLSVLGFLLIHSWAIPWVWFSRYAEVIAKREWNVPDEILRYIPQESKKRYGWKISTRDIFVWFYSILSGGFFGTAMVLVFEMWNQLFIPALEFWLACFLVVMLGLLAWYYAKLKPEMVRIESQAVGFAYEESPSAGTTS